jgi:hypothetical protein
MRLELPTIRLNKERNKIKLNYTLHLNGGLSDPVPILSQIGNDHTRTTWRRSLLSINLTFSIRT